MNVCKTTVILLLVFACHWADAADRHDIRTIGKLDRKNLPECSGIAASRQFANVFWVHNDSGHAPELFAVKRTGELVSRHQIAAPNLDWEDIAVSADNRIYLGDLGDNFGIMPFRVIYRFREPNPADSETSKTKLEPDASFRFRYPNDQRLDCESLCIDDRNQQAILIAKFRNQKDAEVYTVPLDQPAPLLKPAIAKKVGSLGGFKESATAADLSSNGRFLAVCGYSVLRIYELRDNGRWHRKAEIKYKPRDTEALGWDGADLLLTGEDQTIERVRFRPPLFIAAPKTSGEPR